MAPWANGKNGKEYRATLGNKAIGGIFNVGIVSPYRWLNSIKIPKPACGSRMASPMACGRGSTWFRLTRQARAEGHRRSLRLASQWEKYLRNTEPIARMGLVYSQQTALFRAGPLRVQRLEDHPSASIRR